MKPTGRFIYGHENDPILLITLLNLKKTAIFVSTRGLASRTSFATVLTRVIRLVTLKIGPYSVRYHSMFCNNQQLSRILTL